MQSVSKPTPTWTFKKLLLFGWEGKDSKLILLFKQGIIVSPVKLNYFTVKWPNLDFSIQVTFHLSHTLSSEWIKLALCHLLPSMWQKKEKEIQQIKVSGPRVKSSINKWIYLHCLHWAIPKQSTLYFASIPLPAVQF